MRLHQLIDSHAEQGVINERIAAILGEVGISAAEIATRSARLENAIDERFKRVEERASNLEKYMWRGIGAIGAIASVLYAINTVHTYFAPK